MQTPVPTTPPGSACPSCGGPLYELADANPGPVLKACPACSAPPPITGGTANRTAPSWADF